MCRANARVRLASRFSRLERRKCRSMTCRICRSLAWRLCLSSRSMRLAAAVMDNGAEERPLNSRSSWRASFSSRPSLANTRRCAASACSRACSALAPLAPWVRLTALSAASVSASRWRSALATSDRPELKLFRAPCPLSLVAACCRRSPRIPSTASRASRASLAATMCPARCAWPRSFAARWPSAPPTSLSTMRSVSPISAAIFLSASAAFARPLA
mmetsp:Transcript_86677/g.240360  ORF Transcript_86677/g.240360 Transcript_86677/m.240360 type:complete len:216 (+) Transcript_86677:585-1232(+)